MKRTRKPITYANVASTIALFLALAGGVALAAGRIHSSDIAPKAIKTNKIAPEAVKAGKIARGAVVADRIANGAVSSPQIADGAVTPSKLQTPVSFVANPAGGSSPLTERSEFAYPLSENTWTQQPGEFDIVYGEIEATVAAASGSEPCEVEIGVLLNGRKFGEGGGPAFSSNSTSPEQVTQPFGAQPNFNFQGPVSKKLTMTVSANGCANGSAIQSTQVRVLGIS